jgi:uncharacterized membrane protein
MALTLAHKQLLAGLALIICISAGIMVVLPQETGVTNDIYYTYLEGKRLVVGENPYARILAGNMRQNQKYSTYLPLFYLLSALSQRAGLADFAAWLSSWRVVFLICNLATATLLGWVAFARRRGLWLAALAAIFWLFNRWNLYDWRLGNMDYIPILFLVLSLLLLQRQPHASYILLGVSLALKQMAILLVPLYLIHAWQSAPTGRTKSVLYAGLEIAAVPALLAIPFLLWQPEGFVRSILFSFTRNEALHVEASSFGDLIGLPPPAARMLMLLLCALCYAIFYRKTIGFERASLLVMAVFINFNSVLFVQYFLWLVVLVPLAVTEKWPLSEVQQSEGLVPALVRRADPVRLPAPAGAAVPAAATPARNPNER